MFLCKILRKNLIFKLTNVTENVYTNKQTNLQGRLFVAKTDKSITGKEMFGTSVVGRNEL
jgi:hypothetical protein